MVTRNDQLPSDGDDNSGDQRVEVVPHLAEQTSTGRGDEAVQRERSAHALAGTRVPWRMAAVAAAFIALLACVLLASLSSDSSSRESDGEESAPSLLAAAAPPPNAAARSLVMVRGTSAVNIGCRSVQEGEPCHRHVQWAMTSGITTDGDLFPGLTSDSPFEAFQAAMQADPYARCPRPCAAPSAAGAETQAEAEDGGNKTENYSDTPALPDLIGWKPSSRMVAEGQWCSAHEPEAGWALESCGDHPGLQIKVLTYNLWWWHLFGRRHGGGGSAGHLIARAGSRQPFDVMAFQECEDIGWVLSDAGAAQEYVALTGPHALCIAYRKAAWSLVDDGADNVNEDRGDQWYGTRAGMWVRLRHMESGQVVFFVNHHGPLPIHTGGRCGGEATAYNLLRLISSHARVMDVIVLVGDFNAGPMTSTLRSLHGRLHSLITGSKFGGVDHILSSCRRIASTRNLGPGGSDHDALEAVIQL